MSHDCCCSDGTLTILPGGTNDAPLFKATGDATLSQSPRSKVFVVLDPGGEADLILPKKPNVGDSVHVMVCDGTAYVKTCTTESTGCDCDCSCDDDCDCDEASVLTLLAGGSAILTFTPCCTWNVLQGAS